MKSKQQFAYQTYVRRAAQNTKHVERKDEHKQHQTHTYTIFVLASMHTCVPMDCLFVNVTRTPSLKQCICLRAARDSAPVMVQDKHMYCECFKSLQDIS